MKVCFIAGTLGRGGAERQLVFMIKALLSSGIDTRVLCLTSGEAYESEIKKLGIEVEWIGLSNNRLSRLLKIIRNIRRQPPDIVQSVHFYTNIYVGLAGRILGINNIGAIRSDLAFELEMNNHYGKWQLKLPQHLISNSLLAKKRASDYGIRPKKVEYLRNVVELDTARGIRPFDPSNKTLTIMFAGRLSREKRPEIFVKLATRLVNELPHIPLNFVIAGDGPLRAELESTVAAAALGSGSVSFLGQLDEMDYVYGQSDILVLTSEHEGTPNVVLEAMSFGIPVVATKVGGVSEILDSDRGFLIHKDDFDGILKSVVKLINDPKLRRRLGNNGRAYVSNNHSLEYLKVRLTGIYCRMLGGEQRNA